MKELLNGDLIITLIITIYAEKSSTIKKKSKRMKSIYMKTDKTSYEEMDTILYIWR